MKRTILCVGNCGFDQSTLNAYLAGRFDAAVVEAATAATADATIRSHRIDLVLVNRVFDRDGDSGIDWIRRHVSLAGSVEGEPHARAMLISGYSDAQREAIKSGAVPGFGKDDLRSEVAAERIAAALEAPTPGATSSSETS